jgi:RNA polymerase sigma-70 factor (ECF subfamily)
LPELTFDYDATLLACARGERQALQRLYEQEGARLLGVARQLVRDTGLAEDIVHDAFIKIWTGAGSFDPHRGSARGWMFSVTRHLALNYLRSQGREVQVEDSQALDALAALGSTHEDADGWEGVMHAERIHLCLEQLEPERRRCVIHAYVDGYSHAEISQKLATPLGTVKAWIKRSLVALRGCMG